jgi:hypothetical protein
MSFHDSSTAKITSHAGPTLRDGRVRSTVQSAAHAIAERIGVQILNLAMTDEAIEVTLACDEVAALGFAAELRRLTEAWHQTKYHDTLWGQPPVEEGEEWKRV